MPEMLKDATAKAAHGANNELTETVRGIIADIETRGETAVRELSEKFDSWSPEAFRLSDQQIADVVATVDPQTIADITFAQTDGGQRAHVGAHSQGGRGEASGRDDAADQRGDSG